MHHHYAFPRHLTLQAGLLRFAYLLCSLVFIGAGVCVFAAQKSETALFALSVLLLCWGLGFYLEKRSKQIDEQIKQAYQWAPAGVYFTGSLYRQRQPRRLFGKPGAPVDGAFTRLTANPYPDGEAIGSNGVVSEPNGNAWLVRLVSVNGFVHATRVGPAEYGWQEFIKYRV